MDIRWQDIVTDLDVLDRTGLVSPDAVIIKALLCWMGHVTGMDSSRIPCKLRYVVLMNGHRNLGHPMEHYKVSVRAGTQHPGQS